MSGIYIHIPFCKQACHYCNFHFSTSLKYKDEMVNAIVKEIHLRKSYLTTSALTSIYFGGGTPSLLTKNDLDKIFNALAAIYTWDATTEITLEANPDDLSIANLDGFKSSEINRLSIGVQSFDQADLTYMNRAHNANEAMDSIKMAQDIGFDNISADLIYGSPTTSNETWESNIQKMIDLNIPHISAYCLTVEEGTALHHFVASGKSKPVDDTKSSFQFDVLMNRLKDNGFDHYEISNFGKPDRLAIHNTNYWKGVPYLGLGPAAHSFDGQSTRSWNIAHNPKYISKIENNELPIEHEVLSNKELFNEFVLIRLRTKWGIDKETLLASFEQFSADFIHKINPFILDKKVRYENDIYSLTDKGRHFADRIAMELFAE